ncbi:MAG TPA: hypothetical protein VFC41_06220 [Anaerovoracaceae bacterium]|nr:hypothetical protein [Anaerovoracaceae bacterium]
MKKLIFFALLITGALPLKAQAIKAELLQDLEKNRSSGQNVTTTATLKSSSRLFGTKDDLTTVILIIPSGSTVAVLDSDSTYFHVTFEENEGYIFKRHAVIDKSQPVNIQQTVQPQQPIQEEQSAPQQNESRFSYLENKYGSNMAARLVAGKIWKGMNAEMVRDSWGRAEKINRVISGNIIKEEWIFKNTWLYFENNSLVGWGPIRK